MRPFRAPIKDCRRVPWDVAPGYHMAPRWGWERRWMPRPEIQIVKDPESLQISAKSARSRSHFSDRTPSNPSNEARHHPSGGGSSAFLAGSIGSCPEGRCVAGPSGPFLAGDLPVVGPKSVDVFESKRFVVPTVAEIQLGSFRNGSIGSMSAMACRRLASISARCSGVGWDSQTEGGKNAITCGKIPLLDPSPTSSAWFARSST